MIMFSKGATLQTCQVLTGAFLLKKTLVCCQNAHLFIMEILILTHSHLIFSICHSLVLQNTLSNKFEL